MTDGFSLSIALTKQQSNDLAHRSNAITLFGKAYERKEEALYKVCDCHRVPCCSYCGLSLIIARVVNLFRGKPASLGSRFMAVAGPDADASMTQDKENAF